MDFQKTILYVALGFTLLMIYEAWQEDYVRPKTAPGEVTTEVAAGDTPTLPPVSGSQPVQGSGDTPVVNALKSGKRITVETDLFNIEIDTRGGDLRRAELKHYAVSGDKPDVPFRLMDDEQGIFIAQSGLLSTRDSNSPSPGTEQIYSTASDSYTLSEGAESLEVRLSWRDESGVSVDKVYTFYRDKYLIDVRFEISNGSANEWKGHMYRQLARSRPEEENTLFMYTYTGGVIYSAEEKYEKIEFDDMDDGNLSRNITGGWAAIIQHYFLGAWIPSAEEGNSYYSKVVDKSRYLLGMVGSALSVHAGEKGSIRAQLYVGPKIQDELEEIAEGLELTVDYGVLTILAKPLFWLLKIIHGMVNNWGWSIILLTVLIKAVFYKLSETSYKSMAHMRKLQPKLQQLKENYGDDKQKLNEAMMRMYREEKINPLGGCLPILVQIPVFIALYWMLLESVEIRQQPFMLWITDLTAKDPYFILPVLMGATMLIQHKLNPTPLDPIQARVMMILPIAFTFFFLWFPSGLVLYWVVNNTLSIIQQYYITRVVIGNK
ncbi:MAG: membrane protein insertase YidC [Chromatiales bacterium]|nr:membrane protein insertase YidC [Chromatiales bacterium]